MLKQKNTKLTVLMIAQALILSACGQSGVPSHIAQNAADLVNVVPIEDNSGDAPSTEPEYEEQQPEAPAPDSGSDTTTTEPQVLPLPQLTSPLTTSLISAQDLVLQGICENGSTVQLIETDMQAQVCQNSSYSFTVHKDQDGVYNFIINQVNSQGLVSGNVLFQWTRDTVIPSAPTLINQVSSSLTSSDATLTLIGQCDIGKQIVISGDVSADELVNSVLGTSQTCASDTYSFTIAKTQNGTYNFVIEQIGANGLASSPVNFQWIKTSVLTVLN